MNTSKYKKLLSFSNHFNIRQEDVSRLGFFDAILGVDSRLYIDPKLVKECSEVGFDDAASKLTKAFSKLFTLIKQSDNKVYKEAVIKYLSFKEIRGTCLGYSSDGVNGSCIGPKIRNSIIERIKEIIDSGHVDYEIFELLDIFVEGFGCDRTSDFIAHFIESCIIKYNLFIIEELKLYDHPMIRYNDHLLLQNPIRPDLPILLLPKTILSDLPVFYSFEDLNFISSISEKARKNLQKYVDLTGDWNKDKMFNVLLNDSEAYESIVDSYRQTKGKPYSFELDKKGLFVYKEIALQEREKHPELFADTSGLIIDNLYSVVKKCVSVFKHLVEDCGLRKSVKKYDEKAAQNLFLATCYIYCVDNDIALLPECDSGRGPVDFVFTNGKEKISVELKKSSNTNYKDGLSKQLVDYMRANESVRGFFLFFNVDSEETKKKQSIIKRYNELPEEYKNKIDLEIIESFDIPSASK